jgi:hypothetical protein
MALLVVALVAADAEYGAAQTGQMPKPDSHNTADFLQTHQRTAKADITFCAACHARDYCSRCHVNAYDVPEIQALPSDPDVAAYVAGTEWPAPSTHTPSFLEDHRAVAAGATQSCTTCHVVEEQCLICHLGSETLERPRTVTDVDLYHPDNFVQQHSASAWNQETECATCHNPWVFCLSCHQTLGYAASDGRTDTGFHNKDPNFTFGHGQAARQGLESCAACHPQENCLQCHSARSRNINPHGPGFNAEKLASKNQNLCLFCHFSVPGGE